MWSIEKSKEDSPSGIKVRVYPTVIEAILSHAVSRVTLHVPRCHRSDSDKQTLRSSSAVWIDFQAKRSARSIEMRVEQSSVHQEALNLGVLGAVVGIGKLQFL